jgi:hypothetical protein
VIALEPGAARTVIIDVTAESGNVLRTTLKLNREAPRDTNARLARLQLSGAQLSPNFDPRVVTYTAMLAANVPSVTLTAVAESTAATIAVDGQPLARTGRVIALEPGAARTVIIDVTAESGDIVRTILKLNREAPQDTNARLARLQLSGAQLNPGFDARTLEYSAKLAADVPSVTLTAVAESPAASIEVDGQPLARNGRVIGLDQGDAKTVVIDVTADAGNVVRTVLRLSREAAPAVKDKNARLADLQLDGAQLNPNFDARTLEYSAKLAADVASVTLTALAESPAASIAVDGQPLARTGRVIGLDQGGSKTVVIDVTAEAGNVVRTILRLSREAGSGPGPGPIVNPGNYRISVTMRSVKVDKRELTSISSNKGSIGTEAQITVRNYRTSTVVAQGTAKISLKMQATTPLISAQWTSPGVKLDQGSLVEIEVAIPAGGSNWLYYTEAQWADSQIAVDVPFLLYSSGTRVNWPTVGRPVSVVGYVAFSSDKGGPRMSEARADPDSLQLNAKGQYSVDVTITDASGRVLANDTVWVKPGSPRSQVVSFTQPLSLPEGSTVRYTLRATTKNGKGWEASGTTQVWTTTPVYEGGFEPVILHFGEDLAPQK